MTLADFLDDVETRRMTVSVYASEAAPDVAAHFETRNVTVERETLPSGGPNGFVVVRDDDGFVGAFGLTELADLLAPPVFRPWDHEDVSRPWRDLYEILDNTLFAAFDRRQLLAVAREIENRAWRVGDGTLRVGFQRPAAYRAQADVYRRLQRETDLTIHVYLDEDWDEALVPDVNVHAPTSGEIGAYWFLAFDAAGDPTNCCALLGEERSSGSYYGFWTYDPDRVERLSAYLRATYE